MPLSCCGRLSGVTRGAGLDERKMDIMAFDINRLMATFANSTIWLDEWAGRSRPSIRVHVYDEVASTSQTLWELVQQGAGEGTVAIALQQTTGRGQWGRQWQSAPGGLYLSVALELDIPVSMAAQLTLCSAWGIAAGLRAQGAPVQIKWLNDLVIEGRKLGGILTETRVRQGRVAQAVVGVGVNWANPVPPGGVALRSVWGEGAGFKPGAIAALEDLAAVVLEGVLVSVSLWRSQGMEFMQPRYEALLVNLGQSVAIAGQSGVIVGITPNGDLRVQLEAATHAGDGVGSQVGAEVVLEPGSIQLGYGLHLAEPPALKTD